MDLEDCPSLTSQCYLCLSCSLARDPMSLLPELQTMQLGAFVPGVLLPEMPFSWLSAWMTLILRYATSEFLTKTLYVSSW